MVSLDQRWTIVLNGEIYNFPELRRNLLHDGVELRTHADTEVLVELIAREGVLAALEKIEGMFAFAVVDAHSGDLWLARDRFGEKPLYLDYRGGGFAFCSELQPLLVARALAVRPSAEGVLAILRMGYPWPGTTSIEGLEELEPSHWLRRGPDGNEQRGRYWHPPDRIDEEAGSLERCGERVVELLYASVKARLVSDVPLGLFLSGGIDSGCVAAAAVEERKDIRAVTVGFEGTYDERPLARLTAQKLAIGLEEHQLHIQSFTEAAFDDVLSHYGQPFEDTSAFPTRAVSRAARQQFTVVLSGDGGDELFSGYLAHQRNARLQRWGGGPAGARLSSVASRLMGSSSRLESVHRALLLNGARHNGGLPFAMQGVFTDESLGALVEGTPWSQACRHFLGKARQQTRELWESVSDSNLALSLFMLKFSMPQDILTKVDRMSMAESLEVRAPFLDRRLATYALSLPAHLKMRRGSGKVVLREAMRGRLPDQVLDGAKHGFNLPVRAWLGDLFWKKLDDEVSSYAALPDAELNVAALRERVKADREVVRSKNSYRALHRAIVLYSFLRWRQLFVGRINDSLSARQMA
jgi:asparagine synthase (glutamine-hydrolysing)